MASVSYSQNYGDNVNPTTGYLPYNAGGYFADSNVYEDAQYTQIKGSGYNFFNYDRTYNLMTLGNLNASNSYVYMDIQSGTMEMNAINGLRINASTSGTAGGSATHLILNVNGTNYKVQLLNP